MHSVIFIFVLLQIFIFVFYIIRFLSFKAAGRGPKVAARGGKCLLRSRNVAGIEILQGFSSMKWCKMFFLFKCGIILKKKQSSTGKPAKLGIISIIPLNLISSN